MSEYLRWCKWLCLPGIFLGWAELIKARQLDQDDFSRPVELSVRHEGCLRGFVIEQDRRMLRLLTSKGKVKSIPRRQIRRSARLMATSRGHDAWDYPDHKGENISGSIIAASGGTDRFSSLKLGRQWCAYQLRLSDHISIQALRVRMPGISHWIFQPHVQTHTGRSIDFGTGLFMSWDRSGEKTPMGCMPYSAVYWQNAAVQWSLGLAWRQEKKGWGSEPLFMAACRVRCSRNCVFIFDQRMDASYKLHFLQAGFQYESSAWKFSLALPYQPLDTGQRMSLLPMFGIQYLFPG